jgi:hypothetical protein
MIVSFTVTTMRTSNSTSQTRFRGSDSQSWHLTQVKSEGEAIPITNRADPLGSETSRLSHFLDNRLTHGGEVISLTLLPPFTPRKILTQEEDKPLTQLSSEWYREDYWDVTMQLGRYLPACLSLQPYLSYPKFAGRIITSKCYQPGYLPS